MAEIDNTTTTNLDNSSNNSSTTTTSTTTDSTQASESQSEGKSETKKKKQFVTPEILSKALGPEGMDFFKKISINPGVSFLEGKETSTFVKSLTKASNTKPKSEDSTKNNTAKDNTQLANTDQTNSNEQNSTNNIVLSDEDEIVAKEFGIDPRTLEGPQNPLSSSDSSGSTTNTNQTTNIDQTSNTSQTSNNTSTTGNENLSNSAETFNTSSNNNLNQENEQQNPSIKDTMKKATSVATTAMGIAEKFKGYIENPEQLQQIIMDIINMAMNIMMKEISKMIEETTIDATQIIMSIPMDIGKKSLVQFNKKKKSTPKLLAELTKTSEDEAEKKVEKSQEKEKNEKIEKVKKTANKINKEVNKFMTDANVQLTQIAYYIEEGPDFIQKKVNQIIYEQLEKAKNYKDQQVEIVKEEIDKFTDKQGENLGNIMADKYNKQMKKLAEKQKNKIEQKKKVAHTKSKAKMQKGLLKIMAMTGINLPM